MKKILTVIFGVSLMTAAFADDSTQTVTGDGAKALYTALVQADLPGGTDDGTTATISAPKDMKCDLSNGGGVYTDDIQRGNCTGIQGTASAVAIGDALSVAGVNDNAGMSQIRPAAKSVDCTATNVDVAPYYTYSCTITADFSQDD